VVSMILNFNRAIFEGLRIAAREQNRPATPMVTIVTDLADCPPINGTHGACVFDQDPRATLGRCSYYNR